MSETASTPRLSVIIPTRNRPASLLRALGILVEELERHALAGDVEIVVVDDAGDRRAAEQIEAGVSSLPPNRVQIVRLPRRRGASGARNAGVERSRGGVLAFLDDDIVPAGDYLRETIALHAREREVLVANGNLRPLRNDVYSRFWFHLYDATFNRAGELYCVPMLASGHCSLKRSVLTLENPLFDVELSEGEDLDLYLRLRRRGIEVYKCDRILAYNDCRDSLPAFVRQYSRYERSNGRVAAKHGLDVLRAAQAARPLRRQWRFVHLYVLLRLARHAVLFDARLRALLRTSAAGEDRH